MNRTAISLLALVLFASSARADLTINALGAGAAVSGTDVFPAYQGANPATGVTAAQIKTFVGAGLTCDTGFTPVFGQCVWTIAASNSASLAWTGLTRNSYTMTCDGLTPVSATAFLVAQMGEGAGPTWHTGATDYNTQKTLSTGATPSAFGGGQPGIGIAYQPPNSGAVGATFAATFTGLQSAENKAVTFLGLNMNGGNPVTASGGAYDTHSTAAITSIRAIDAQTTPGNISTGSCTLRQNGT